MAQKSRKTAGKKVKVKKPAKKKVAAKKTAKKTYSVKAAKKTARLFAKAAGKGTTAAKKSSKNLVRRTIKASERPEALAKFAQVARHDDGKPVREGVQATAETSPIPTDPTLKQDAATRVLREGVLHKDQGAEEAIDRLPDRTDAPGRHPKGE